MLVVVSFGCCTTKIGTQYITEGVILMPNYVPDIQNTNFCCVDTMVQTPKPMTYIGEGDVICTMVGYDCYGKIDDFEFYVKRLNDE